MNNPQNQRPAQNKQAISFQSNQQNKKLEEFDKIKKEFKDMTENITSFIRRVRVLEEKFENQKKKVNLLDKNFIDAVKTSNKKVTELNKEIFDLRRSISKLKDNLHIMVSDLKETAKLNHVKELEKYIEMWQPAKFITVGDADAIVKRQVERQFSDMHVKFQEEEMLERIAEKLLRNNKDYFFSFMEEKFKQRDQALKQDKAKPKKEESEIKKKRKSIWDT